MFCKTRILCSLGRFQQITQNYSNNWRMVFNVHACNQEQTNLIITYTAACMLSPLIYHSYSERWGGAKTSKLCKNRKNVLVLFISCIIARKWCPGWPIYCPSMQVEWTLSYWISKMPERLARPILLYTLLNAHFRHSEVQLCSSIAALWA